MWSAFPTSDYYGGSVPPRPDRSTVDPAPPPRWTAAQGTTGTVPVFTDRSLVEGGARLYPRGIATTTPQSFIVASGHTPTVQPGVPHRRQRCHRRVRTAPSPHPSGSSWWSIRRLHTPVPRVHLSVSLAGPVPSDGPGTSRLHRGPLAVLPGTSRLGLPPAPTALLRQDGDEGLFTSNRSISASRRTWVSHETIYRSLFVQAKGALQHELTAAHPGPPPPPGPFVPACGRTLFRCDDAGTPCEGKRCGRPVWGPQH